MSKLSGLKSKSKVYNIGGVDLEIFPLGLDDMELMNIPEDATQDEQQKALMTLINKVLMQSVPDATEEEIKKFVKMDHMTEIQDAIMDVCGMNKGNNRQDLVKKRIDAIKSKQNTE